MPVRREQPSDAAAIHAVHTAAFGRGRTGEIAEATLWELLLTAADAVRQLSFVTTIDGDVVGHAGVSTADIDGRRVVALGPVGVLPSHQLVGIGSAMVRAVLSAADAAGEPVLVLLGSPDYYARFGFELATPLGVIPPDAQWEPHFQLRRLSGWDPALRGEFHYAPAFSIV